MPPLVLAGLDGVPIRSADWRGRTVVLNIWATWCVPCREEMPALQRLHAALDPTQFRVIGLSVDEDANLVREFKLRYELSFPLALDPTGALAQGSLGSRALPDTLIVGPDGRLADRVAGGADWDAPAVRARVLAVHRGELEFTPGRRRIAQGGG